MPEATPGDAMVLPRIVQPIEEIVTRRIVREIDETGRGAGAAPRAASIIAGPHADDYYRDQRPTAAHAEHGNVAHAQPAHQGDGPRSGGLGIFLAVAAIGLVLLVGALLAFTDKGKQVTALLLGQPQQDTLVDSRDVGPAKYKPAIYAPEDARTRDRREGPRPWAPPPQSRQDRLPTPEEISRRVPHYITRVPARCADGYWQDADGWCHEK